MQDDNDLAVDAGDPGTSDDTRTGGLKERLGRQDDDERQAPRYFREGRNGDLEEVTPTQIAGKRIGQLTAKYNEEKLARTSLESANERLQRLLHASNADANTLYESTVANDLEGGKADLTRIQADLKAAIDTGDTEKQAALTVELSQTTSKVAKAQTEKERIEAQKKRGNAGDTADTGDTSTEQRPAGGLSPRAQAWADANPWFNKDSAEYDADKRALALGVHEALVDEGVKAGTDAYFTQLNHRLKTKFAKLGGRDDEIDPEPEPEPRPKPNGKTTDSRFAVPASRGHGGEPPRGSRSLIKLNAEQRAAARALQQSEPVYALGVMLADGRITEDDYHARFAEYANAGKAS